MLHINEKKVYQLASEGNIPCTKVTGKWIFPYRLVEQWLNENSHGGAMADRLLISGSEDMLLEQHCRKLALQYRDSALISYTACGSLHGLRLLDSRRTDACLVNWGPSQQASIRHQGLLRSFKNHKHWVTVRLLQRRQGLVLSPTTRLNVIADEATQTSKRKINIHPSADLSTSARRLLSNKQLRWAQRHQESGTQRLLADTLAANSLSVENLNTSMFADSERTAVAAVARGIADITLASESAATQSNLHFIPLDYIALDLVMSRKTYFRSMLQNLLTSLQQDKELQSLYATHCYRFPTYHELLSLD